MFHIKVIESGLRNEEHQIIVNNQDLYFIIKKLYGDGFGDIFDPSGISKGFVRIFVNSKIIESLKGVQLSEGDEVQVISAFSGG